MRAEQSPDGLSHEHEATGFQWPEHLEVGITSEGKLALTGAEQHRDSLTDTWSVDIGPVELVEDGDQLMVTIEKHQLRSLTEIADIDRVLQQAGSAANARQIMITRVVNPFNSIEVAGLREFGYHRPKIDRVRQLHPHQMVKDLPPS